MSSSSDTPARILVTGATGFIGGHLAAFLGAQGHRVYAIHRPSSAIPGSWKRLGIVPLLVDEGADIRRAVAVAAPDTVYHLAAAQDRGTAPDQIDRLIAANVTLGTQLLEALAGTSAVVVGASSYFQYRDGVATPHSLYAATKQAMTEIGRYYADLRGVRLRQAVLYDTYGPGDLRDKLIPSLLRAAREDRVIAVGPLEQRLNLLHVDDVVRGLMRVGLGPDVGTTSVRAATTVSVGEIVSTLERVVGRRIRVMLDRDRSVSDQALLAGEWPVPSDWAPSVSLESGLAGAYAAL